MTWLPWILALAAVAVVAWLMLRPKEYPGADRLDARGNIDRDRAPPANVDPTGELFRAIGDATAAALATANTYWKQ